MDFNFISDEQFRASLASDYGEMEACAEARSWKAVHVLAGSIVEALLIEYLVVSGAKPNGKDPLKLTLDEAIQACHSAGVLQKSTAALCEIVREYRNLIHPGRIVRLSQEVTPEAATIARSLIRLIVKDVSEKRKVTYGPTAEQILKKLRTDQHSLAVLPQLLSEANEHEKRKLVQRVIPDAYREDQSDELFFEPALEARLRSGYRQALELLPPPVKVEVAAHFAKLVREESSENVESYGEAFFLSSDIDLLSPQDRQLVLGHLKNRLETAQRVLNDGLMRQTSSLGRHLPLTEILGYADTLIRLVSFQPDGSSTKVIDWAGEAFDVADAERKEIMQARIEAWVRFGKNKEFPVERQQRLEKLEMKWIDVPF